MKLLRCKGVESESRSTMTPLVVVSSTSRFRSFLRNPSPILGLQAMRKANNEKHNNFRKKPFWVLFIDPFFQNREGYDLLRNFPDLPYSSRAVLSIV